MPRRTPRTSADVDTTCNVQDPTWMPRGRFGTRADAGSVGEGGECGGGGERGEEAADWGKAGSVRGARVPGASTSTSMNPVARLADAMLGTSAKTQERLRELPGVVGVGEASTSGAQGVVLPGLPGSEYERGFHSPLDRSDSSFLQGFSGRDGEFAEAWTDATHLHLPGEELGRPPFLHDTGEPGMSAAFEEFENIYGQEARRRHFDEDFSLDDGAQPERVLSGFLRSFLDSTRSEMPFHAVRLPELGLSDADKRCIRDRSSIMARHFFADKGDEYATAQVSALLQSLDITAEDESRLREPMGGRFDEFDDYWGESTARNQKQMWREEAGVMADRRAGSEAANLAAMRQTKSLVETLSQNQDPKFKNSRFLQFVSKMSRGELIFDENGVKPGVESKASEWAAEFQEEHGPKSWVNEFSHASRQQDQWADEFAEQVSDTDWTQEFGEQVARGAFSGTEAEWLDSYNKFVEEQVKGEAGKSASSRWLYQFADQNPYVGHPNPLREGQELFRKGLLSEAILALEAEVLKNPTSVDGWRLLGIAHAENDDDRQAIASMSQAREADPTNLEVLLSLGVSHTNELEAAEALDYLKAWLQNHPKYGHLVTQATAPSMTHSEALDLKPNYVRAWSNMGIGYANQGLYGESIRYYVRALSMNPKADNAWNYLRIAARQSLPLRMVCVHQNSERQSANRYCDVWIKRVPLHFAYVILRPHRL
ncbi:hypothetical protein CBR_g45681 [Chara braunii]|uniref:Uncharacterized protein n=1 Tax=Chara braunii TaxID=69332 RepID=A0A388K3L2_CHABU|nr:hypothetical protein CBR_g45681 [Chara braunii]|eukprot:GBG64625.1 hypothetical protein CBR_g45681 [Chara braunii]